MVKKLQPRPYPKAKKIADNMFRKSAHIPAYSHDDLTGELYIFFLRYYNKRTKRWTNLTAEQMAHNARLYAMANKYHNTLKNGKNMVIMGITDNIFHNDKELEEGYQRAIDEGYRPIWGKWEEIRDIAIFMNTSTPMVEAVRRKQQGFIVTQPNGDCKYYGNRKYQRPKEV